MKKNPVDIEKFVFYLLNIKDYTEKELYTKLIDNYDEKDVNNIISKLKNTNLINDKKYAENFVLGKLESGKYSINYIYNKLLEKGIKNDIIDEVFKEHNINNETDYEIAKKIIDKKFLRYKTLNKEQISKKIARFLSSKSFSEDIIEKILYEFN